VPEPLAVTAKHYQMVMFRSARGNLHRLYSPQPATNRTGLPVSICALYSAEKKLLNFQSPKLNLGKRNFFASKNLNRFCNLHDRAAQTLTGIVPDGFITGRDTSETLGAETEMNTLPFGGDK
jgi:hypothetical protein